MKKYIAKPNTVEAEQFIKGINTPSCVRYNPKSHPEAYLKIGNNAETIVDSGDYIVYDTFGNVFKLSQKQFNDTYKEE
jgi:hypothetical protein